MKISRHRLILKVFLFTMLFTGILLFFYRDNNILLPSIGDHTYQQSSYPIRQWPYRSAQTGDSQIKDIQISGLLQQVESDLNELLQTLSLNEHQSPFAEAIARKKYDDMCQLFSSLCELISREGDFKRQEYYYYQGLFIILARYIDTSLNYSPTLSPTLERLTLYKDDSGRRWWAAHTVARINTQLITTNREFREVLTHEFGHIIDLGAIQWSTPVLDTNFTEFGKQAFSVDDPSLGFYRISRSNELVRKQDAIYKDFVSWYAMQWPFEDMAETFNMYVNHYDLFVQMQSQSAALEQKFAFVDRLFGGRKWHWTTRYTTRDLKAEIRERDTTKLYTLVN